VAGPGKIAAKHSGSTNAPAGASQSLLGEEEEGEEEQQQERGGFLTRGVGKRHSKSLSGGASRRIALRNDETDTPAPLGSRPCARGKVPEMPQRRVKAAAGGSASGHRRRSRRTEPSSSLNSATGDDTD